MMKVAGVMLLLGVMAQAQEAANAMGKGAREFGLWTAGGTSVSGGTGDVKIWSAGLRIGKVLTSEHGPGPLRGTLEYAIDAIPACLVFHSETSYSAGINPFILKWNFTASRRVTPFFEFGGGLLFSPDEIPAGTSKVNFTPQAGLGLHLFTRERRAVTLGARYVHISNAGLSAANPGINTVQFAVGYHWFR